jgi:hypothetical protein
MLYRFTLDLAIPQTVFEAISTAKIQTLKDNIRALKALAVKVNAGQPNEEMTVKATWHKCHHDETPSTCEPEQEI